MTSENDPQIVAAELALGVLSGTEHATATARLHAEPQFAALVADWENLLSPIAGQLEPVAPPAALLDEIEATIARRELPLPLSRTLRAHEGEWIVVAPGVQTKSLWRNEAVRRHGLLLRLDPGATYPAHDHDDDEECFVLSGDIQFGDLTLHAGDYHVAHKSSHHELVLSRNGCLCLLTVGLTAQ
jgi:anti-sigma factor ChrR (cupin superfamily)